MFPVRRERVSRSVNNLEPSGNLIPLPKKVASFLARFLPRIMHEKDTFPDPSNWKGLARYAPEIFIAHRSLQLFPYSSELQLLRPLLRVISHVPTCLRTLAAFISDDPYYQHHQSMRVRALGPTLASGRSLSPRKRLSHYVSTLLCPPLTPLPPFDPSRSGDFPF